MAPGAYSAGPELTSGIIYDLENSIEYKKINILYGEHTTQEQK
jgi:hypothetical protein